MDRWPIATGAVVPQAGGTMKKLLLTTALALTVLGATASTAAATEITVSSIVCADSTAKPMWGPIGASGDKNGNGAVCVKGKRATDDVMVLTITVSYSSVGGGCKSTAYKLISVQASPNPGLDVNQNGLLCYDPTGKGTLADDITLTTIDGITIQ